MMRIGTTKAAAAVYIALAVLQRGISFFILPFVTHAMSPSEYGAASMLSAAALFLIAMIATPLVQIIIRAAARGDEDGPALLRIAGLYCFYIVPVVLATVAAAFALLVPTLLGVTGFIWAIEILAVGLQPAASTYALWVAQAREDLPRFIAISSVSIATTAISKLVLVVALHLGVLGWVISDLIAAVITAALAAGLIRLPKAIVTSNQVRYLMNFSLPLIPHNVAFWAIAFLSRPAMAAVSSLEQVGLLSLGLNLAQVAGLILAESNRAALPRYSRERFPAPTGETLGIVRWQIVAALAVPAVVGSVIALAGKMIFAEAYWPSLFLAGVLLVSQFAYGLYLVPMNYLTQTAGLPRFSALASGTGAAVILTTVLLFARTYGAAGVSYGTVAAYLMMAVVAFALTLANKLEIEWQTWLKDWPEIVLSGAALGCSVAALTLPAAGISEQVLAISGLVFVAGATLVTLRRSSGGD